MFDGEILVGTGGVSYYREHVYLIQGEHIADLVQRASDTEETFWIIRRKAGTERLQISDELPDTLVYMEIVLEGMEEIYGFMNDLQEIFDAADEWERKIHNLMVEHAGMESLLKVTSEFLQNSLPPAFLHSAVRILLQTGCF